MSQFSVQGEKDKKLLCKFNHVLVRAELESSLFAVAFRIYDIDQDGFISNGELFQVLKTMVGNNLTEKQLQEIVDKTILYADKDGDGKISYEEFCEVSEEMIFFDVEGKCAHFRWWVTWTSLQRWL